MRSYCSLCTFKVPQGANNLILCTLDTIHRFFFATRLIINKINKVQWMDFKLENVLVSLHSLKTMALGTFGTSAPLFLRNGELLGHSPIHNVVSSTTRLSGIRKGFIYKDKNLDIQLSAHYNLRVS